MVVMERPQPALIYILPAILVFYIGAAFLKKETIKMVLYDEDKAQFKIKFKEEKQN